jgi:hypothetical protein
MDRDMLLAPAPLPDAATDATVADKASPFRPGGRLAAQLPMTGDRLQTFDSGKPLVDGHRLLALAAVEPESELVTSYWLASPDGATLPVPVGLDAKGGEPGIGDVEQDGVAVRIVAPDAVQRRVGLGPAVGGALGDQPAREQRADHLGGGAATQAAGQRQDVAVGPLAGSAQDHCLGIGKSGHGGRLRSRGPRHADPSTTPSRAGGAAGLPAEPEVSGRARPRRRRCR